MKRGYLPARRRKLPWHIFTRRDCGGKEGEIPGLFSPDIRGGMASGILERLHERCSGGRICLIQQTPAHRGVLDAHGIAHPGAHGIVYPSAHGRAYRDGGASRDGCTTDQDDRVHVPRGFQAATGARGA